MAKIEMIIEQIVMGRYSESSNPETALRDAIVYSEIQTNPSAYDDRIMPDPPISEERRQRFIKAENEAFFGNRDNLSKLILEDGVSLVTKETPTDRETKIGWALVNLAISIRRLG